jgi:hypothetical protein
MQLILIFALHLSTQPFCFADGMTEFNSNDCHEEGNGEPGATCTETGEILHQFFNLGFSKNDVESTRTCSTERTITEVRAAAGQRFVNFGNEQYQCCESSNTQVCSDVLTFLATNCNPDMPDCDVEICGNGQDDDCNQSSDDGGSCVDQCSPQIDGQKQFAANIGCDVCGRHKGWPVDLMTREAYLAPVEDIHIADGVDGSMDLSFRRIWDSQDASLDDTGGVGDGEDPWDVLGPGWRSNVAPHLFVSGGSDFAVFGKTFTPSTVALAQFEDVIHFDMGTAMNHDATLRYSARNISATATRVDVVSNEGRYIFAAEEGNSTTLYPQTLTGSRREAHFRLFAFYPDSRPRARIRYFYEQDSPEECSAIMNGTGPCLKGRGLLARIAQQFCTASDCSEDSKSWEDGRSSRFAINQLPG